MKLRHMLALTLATLLVGTNAAMAASPVGLWLVLFDPGPADGSGQRICFQSDGTWFSTTFSGWQGSWFQKGNSLRWNGTTGAFLTSAFGTFSSSTLLGEGEYSSMFATTAATSSVGAWFADFVSSNCSVSLARRHSAGAGDPTK